jgi:hypothetical protein
MLHIRRQYGKTRDAGLVGAYMASMFLIPVLLMLVPLIANLGADAPQLVP